MIVISGRLYQIFVVLRIEYLIVYHIKYGYKSLVDVENKRGGVVRVVLVHALVLIDFSISEAQMKKSFIFGVFWFSIILSGCGSVSKPSETVFEHLGGAFDVGSAGEKVLPNRILFFPNGALMDLEIGTLPYYWLAEGSDGKWARDTTTMMRFDQGKKVVPANIQDQTAIEIIKFGSDVGSDDIRGFIDQIRGVVAVSATGGGTVKSAASSEPAKEDASGTKSSATSMNDQVTISLNTEKINSIPSIIFNYAISKSGEISLDSGTSIANANMSSSSAKARTVIAVAPTIYSLRPGNDLGEFLDGYAKISHGKKMFGSGLCEGFGGAPSKEEQKNGGQPTYTVLNALDTDCPVHKFWPVTYLITAKALIHIDQDGVAKLFKAGFKPGALSGSAIDPAAMQLNLNLQSQIGSLMSTTYFKRTQSVGVLAWSCLARGCIPAGPLNSDSSDIPIYAVLSANPSELSQLIKQSPRVNLSMPMK